MVTYHMFLFALVFAQYEEIHQILIQKEAKSIFVKAKNPKINSNVRDFELHN